MAIVREALGEDYHCVSTLRKACSGTSCLSIRSAADVKNAAVTEAMRLGQSDAGSVLQPAIAAAQNSTVW